MNAILTLSDISISKTSETAETGVFMVSDHESNVLANRATLTATGVKPLPKGKMLSVGDDELPQLRDWLYSIMEQGRAAPTGKTKRVGRGMSGSENRAAIADAIKAKEVAENPPVKPPVGISTIGPVELKPAKKAAEKPAKAKKEEPAPVVPEPPKATPAAVDSEVPAEFTGHSRAYKTGRGVKLGTIKRDISHQWMKGIVLFEEGAPMPAKEAGRYVLEGYKAAKKGLNATDRAWVAGYRSV